MSVPGIFKRGRVSIILKIWHLAFIHFLLPVKVGVVEILVLTSTCLRLGGCPYVHSSAVERVFGGRHAAIGFLFFNDSRH